MGDEACETLQWLRLLVYCSFLGRQLAMRGGLSQPAGFQSQPVLLLCLLDDAITDVHSSLCSSISSTSRNIPVLVCVTSAMSGANCRFCAMNLGCLKMTEVLK